MNRECHLSFYSKLKEGLKLRRMWNTSRLQNPSLSTSLKLANLLMKKTRMVNRKTLREISPWPLLSVQVPTGMHSKR